MSKLERIFSITNEVKCSGKRKVVNILGCKIKIKKKYDIDKINAVLDKKISENSILFVECNNSHGETMPGYIKYLYDLGYKVDVIVTLKNHKENPFCRLDEKYINNKICLEMQDLMYLLNSDKIKEYKYIMVNSYYLYFGLNGQPISFFEIFPNTKHPKNGYIFVEHHIDKLNENLLEQNRIIQIADFKSRNHNPVFCNPNYFGEIKQHRKNKIINFITIGSLVPHRRNSNLLIEAVNELYKKGFDNFKITVIGYGSLNKISSELHKFIDIKGRLPFEQMYNQLENADYFLPLLDPNDETHDRYIKDGTSGSFQLIYGFNKPCVIAEKFANYHYFNNENSVVYENNSDFANAMQHCINISDSEYEKLCKNLEKTTEIIRQKSKNNLKEMLEKLTVKTNQ